MTHAQYEAGKILSILPGGIGHAAQGRWFERGWIFAAGIPLTMSAFFVSASIASVWDSKLVSKGAGAALLIAGAGLHVWGIADAWRPPPHYKIVQWGDSSAGAGAFQAMTYISNMRRAACCPYFQDWG